MPSFEITVKSLSRLLKLGALLVITATVKETRTVILIIPFKECRNLDLFNTYFQSSKENVSRTYNSH